MRLNRVPKWNSWRRNASFTRRSSSRNSGHLKLSRPMQPVKLDVQVQETHNGSPAVAVLDGKLVLETVSQFLQTMRPNAAASLVLDMSGVSFLDSAGVGALVKLFVHRRNQSQKFALASLTPQGMAVMQVAGLLKLLPVFPSVAEATSTAA